MKKVNLTAELLKEQNKVVKESALLNQVYLILNSTGNTTHTTNNFDFDLLDSQKIFHLNAIKNTCITYRLRFLDLKYFKNKLPELAYSKIEELEAQHNTRLDGFKIMAPSKLFKLEKADDPLLFVPLGNNYFYLIHKWGNDLSSTRKLLVMPFKNLNNLLVTTFVSSIILTYVFNFSVGDTMKLLILFLFMFKSVIGIVIYYAISQGKNVNAAIWDSKYCK